MLKLVKIGILFDFYGKLLSEKQYKLVDLFYSYDLTQGEIAEDLGISRQAVFEGLKRAEERLLIYEEELGLVKKFYNNQEAILELIELTKKVKLTISDMSDTEIQDVFDLINNKLQEIAQ